MNDADVILYRSAVATAQLCAQLLSQHDLPQLLRDIERADAIGPILDPTLWRDKNKAMEEDKELLEAANKLRAIHVKRARQLGIMVDTELGENK